MFNPENGQPHTNKLENPADSELRQKILDSFEQVGFNEQVDEEIIRRLMLIEKESKFNLDARMIESGMTNVLDSLRENHSEEYPQLNVSEKQRNEGRLAAILHDIGKSGPATASEKEQEAIIKLFAVEDHIDPQTLVEEIVSKHFTGTEKEELLKNLKNCGIHQEMTIREFWDMHAQWTYDILKEYPKNIEGRVLKIAASHHIDHGINPCGLSESEVPLESNIIGVLEEYADVLEKRILMAVDQYQAVIRRKGASHELAMACIRKNLRKFKDEKLMNLVFDSIDKLGARGDIFS